MILTSKEEIIRRCKLIREKMNQSGLKVLVIFAQDQLSYSGAVRYITNYHLTARKEYLVSPLSGEPVLILSTLGQTIHAKAVSWIKDIRTGGETELMIREVVGALQTLKVKRNEIGIVGLNTVMPYYDFHLLQKGMPDYVFQDASELLNEVRWTKSPEEIGMIQETTEIAELCYSRLLKILRVGIDEMEVISEVYKVLVAHGVEDKLILTTKGPSSPGFINFPSPYIFKERDHYIFSVEISGPSGYWSQIIRPLCLGQTTPEYERLFEVGKTALEAGVSRLIPGNTIGEVAKTISEKVKERGFKTGHWSGHGMGLDLGDGIGLFPECPIKVKEGMVLTIHPHIMSSDGKQGLLLGDTFVVENSRARNFSNSLPNRILCI